MRFEWKVKQLKNELVMLKERLNNAFHKRHAFRTDHPCYKVIAKRRVAVAIREIRICNHEIAHWSVQ